MAVFCPNCGTQNPETNRFCQNCGAQMPARAQAPVSTAAPQPAAPPAPAPAPSPAPPAWAPSSPYYTPTQPLTLRRLPVGLIAGAVVALLILMSGVAVVTAAIAKGTGTGSGSHGPTFTPGPSPVAPSPIAGGNASPSPVGQPSPLPSPSSTPTGQGSVCNSRLCLTPAQGWTVKSKDDTSVLLAYNNPAGLAHFQAVKPGSPVKALDELQRFFDAIKKDSPDATICQQAQDLTVGGNKGLYVIACFTFTPQGGQAIKIVQLIWVAASADGTVEYEWDAFSADSDFDNFLKAANSLQHTVQWKI